MNFESIIEYSWLIICGVIVFLIILLLVARNARIKNEASRQSENEKDKLDKIYDVLNHIRWIGLGIGAMFALTFIIPQMCTGG